MFLDLFHLIYSVPAQIAHFRERELEEGYGPAEDIIF